MNGRCEQTGATVPNSIPLSARWSFLARGDIGGFGARYDFARHLQGLFDYCFGERNSLVFGWRHLDWDYDEGDGEGRFGIDSYTTGPVVEISEGNWGCCQQPLTYT